jgi:hypothetical protein
MVSEIKLAEERAECENTWHLWTTDSPTKGKENKQIEVWRVRGQLWRVEWVLLSERALPCRGEETWLGIQGHTQVGMQAARLATCPWKIIKMELLFGFQIPVITVETCGGKSFSPWITSLNIKCRGCWGRIRKQETSVSWVVPAFSLSDILGYFFPFYLQMRWCLQVITWNRGG